MGGSSGSGRPRREPRGGGGWALDIPALHGLDNETAWAESGTGTTVWSQFRTEDPGAPVGFSASNCVRAT